ncbi:hypothetical protein ASPFODRAFT_45400 [Aspergillus luchuensis CBS 106.47]|uniref:Uncharacterized protein n=1 Tax=Aspergillus luchuensis (strain CBS 106.47) TaxID=1137211 RepID=A0A1M3TM20_ASPLC|nr:hypothetical protein ASPFODRAFT_45400 [Aspergillus luchuensis CBS 106.47]
MPPRQGSSRLFGVVSSVQVAVARAKSTRRVPQDKTKRQPGYPRFRCKVSADNWKPRQACQLRESGYPGSLARSSPLSTQISRLIRKVDNPSTRKISKIFFSCRVAPLVRDRGFHVALAGEVMRPGFGVLFCFFSKKRPQRRQKASIHILHLFNCMLWSKRKAFLHEPSRKYFRTQSVAGV